LPEALFSKLAESSKINFTVICAKNSTQGWTPTAAASGYDRSQHHLRQRNAAF